MAGAACRDCVVTVLLGPPEHRADDPAPVMAVDDEHAAAIGVLAASGLVPPLRLVPRSRAG